MIYDWSIFIRLCNHNHLMLNIIKNSIYGIIWMSLQNTQILTHWFLSTADPYACCTVCVVIINMWFLEVMTSDYQNPIRSLLFTERDVCTGWQPKRLWSCLLMEQRFKRKIRGKSTSLRQMEEEENSTAWTFFAELSLMSKLRETTCAISWGTR